MTSDQLPPFAGEGPRGHPGGVEVEVTHEALIRHWPRLRNWLDEDRTALRLRQGISNDAALWAVGQRAEILERQGEEPARLGAVDPVSVPEALQEVVE